MKSEMNISPVLQSLWIYRAWVLLALLAMVSCVAALEFVELKNQISQKNAALDQVKQLTRINEDQNLRLLKLEKIVAKQSESMSELAENIQISDKKVVMLQDHLNEQVKVVAVLTHRIDDYTNKLVSEKITTRKVREKCEYFENTYNYLADYKADKLQCDNIE